MGNINCTNCLNEKAEIKDIMVDDIPEITKKEKLILESSASSNVAPINSPSNSIINYTSKSESIHHLIQNKISSFHPKNKVISKILYLYLF